MKNVYKFVKWDIEPLEGLKNTECYKIMEKLNNNGKLTRDEKNALDFTFSSCCIKLHGYCFDFSPYLKTFWVKTKYYNIIETYGFDKTHIREKLKNFNIIKIVEV